MVREVLVSGSSLHRAWTQVAAAKLRAEEAAAKAAAAEAERDELLNDIAAHGNNNDSEEVYSNYKCVHLHAVACTC